MKKTLFENKILSRKIVQFKEKNNLTYHDLGEGLGVDASYINRVVKRTSHMSLPILHRLAKYMGIPLYALFIPPEDMIREEFISKVQNKMTEKNLSVDDLADEVNISPIHLTGILNGIMCISRKEYDVLSNALNIEKNPYQIDPLELTEAVINSLSLQEKHKEVLLNYIKDNI